MLALALRGSIAASSRCTIHRRCQYLHISGGYAKRLIEIVAFLALISLTMLACGTSAHAQTITVNALTATPASVQPGQTVVFSATLTASANASNYPVEFSLHPPGAGCWRRTRRKARFRHRFKRARHSPKHIAGPCLPAQSPAPTLWSSPCLTRRGAPSWR